MVEWAIESKKVYADPFNDVDVDVVFERDRQQWRVPAFWHGGQRWTVRFAPPLPGKYSYHLESTDRTNPDLNGHASQVTVTAYTGANPLLSRGTFRVSASKRYLEHADGTPFYWLGDTWRMGLSDRLPWDGFQRLTADRKSKGFTVAIVSAGLVPLEEVCPVDAGCRNEGGPVWEEGFTRVNPAYFDAADRRMQLLIDSGLAPAVLGAWSGALEQMGVYKMKKHWRYIIARWSAYPVFWIVVGEPCDPPTNIAVQITRQHLSQPGGWSDVVRYVRATDPVHHPVTVHELPFCDPPLQEESLTDFDMLNPNQNGWASIAAEVAYLNLHYARTVVTKPLVVGEIGYENIGQQHFQDYQRAAFWLAMLNGAAGHTYGADGLFQSQSGDKPLARVRWSFLHWDEGMLLPGSYQLGLNARLLQNHAWWKFKPHPEWVTPRGTTLLEPRVSADSRDGFEESVFTGGDAGNEAKWPGGEWQAKQGNVRLPYAAGIPGETRFIYMPFFRLGPPTPPTVLGLEHGIRYHAYFWDPVLGIKFDLGAVERPPPGAIIVQDSSQDVRLTDWTTQEVAGSEPNAERSKETFSLRKGIAEQDLVASLGVHHRDGAALVLRFQDANNYLVARYYALEKGIYIEERNDGKTTRWGWTPASVLGEKIRLSAEVRESVAIVAVTDGQNAYTSPIVTVKSIGRGGAGVIGEPIGFETFELRESPALVRDAALNKTLTDAEGKPRGELKGPRFPWFGGVDDWNEFGKRKFLLLDAYRPEALPYGQDWVLVLEAVRAP